ncbi:4-coumarate-CoA ligase 2 [Metarhizium album ARSEF 1941]|uniref:4-coumarate-CoA ligase 2 n=1 Tax=Metarhizium album (strain ARSEF 1941) TaxID=1081103 RepID=A0A0B2X4F5_METAS|nr:4-coumarate-CoA ligase 2 [Metarhizium album ARSEF 1941]KHO00638.1 4-coumarate-CoA ligase 2 [Metarhizium album ARSEF 1941]
MPIQSDWTVDIPVIDIWSMYFEQPKEYPDNHVLLVDGDTDRSYTFNDIKTGSVEFGKGLKQMFNWKKGDILGFFTPNCIDTPIVTYGLHWAGGIASPANPTYTADELARQLLDSKATALITQTPFLETAVKAARKVHIPLERVILMGDGRDGAGGHKHWTEITAKGAWFQPKRTVLDPKKDLAYLVYSSGTTGLPKGVMLTHSNVVSNAYQASRLDAKTLNWDSDKHLGVLPFFHIYGLSVTLNVTMQTGSAMIVLPKFDIEKACKLIEKHSITFMYVPPPIVLALGKHPVVDKYDMKSIRWINSGAAPLGVDLVEAVWKRLSIGVKQGYGLSETSPVTHSQLADEWWKFQGSVGRLLPLVEAKIVDENGKELPRGEAGEILLKGPNVFHGYWNRPDMNKETFTEDGWYKTGDVGYACKRGHFYITDRMKELIKYKGFQVPPAELEAKLLGREDINDVCVIGVWDNDQHTEVPRAYVVVRPDVEETDELKQDIINWLGERVGPPKRLRGGVRFTKEIPKSQSGKILRRVLKDQVKKEEGLGTRAKL